MKIIVRSQEKKISLRLPGWLVYGRLPTRIVVAVIARHAPNCGIPPEMLGQLLTSLRGLARTHPGWPLVDLTNSRCPIFSPIAKEPPHAMWGRLLLDEANSVV